MLKKCTKKAQLKVLYYRAGVCQARGLLEETGDSTSNMRYSYWMGELTYYDNQNDRLVMH